MNPKINSPSLTRIGEKKLLNTEGGKENYKVILLGDAGVGKTSIFKRMTKGIYEGNYPITVGEEFAEILYQYDNKGIIVNLWDTAGDERFRSLTKLTFMGTHCAILTYDITVAKTFESMQYWVEEIKNNLSIQPIFVMVGNKVDESARAVHSDLAKNFANNCSIDLFYEVSAKTGNGIEELFNSLILNLVKKFPSSTSIFPQQNNFNILTNPPINKDKKKGCC